MVIIHSSILNYIMFIRLIKTYFPWFVKHFPLTLIKTTKISYGRRFAFTNFLGKFPTMLSISVKDSSFVFKKQMNSVQISKSLLSFSLLCILFIEHLQTGFSRSFLYSAPSLCNESKLVYYREPVFLLPRGENNS